MEDVEKLLKISMAELERVLSSKTVVGETINVGEVTMIPLLSMGFGFGAGGGSGKCEVPSSNNGHKNEGKGLGAGTGGGGGIKPVAMVIIDKSGVRIESIKSGASSALENVGKAIGKAMSKSTEKTHKSKDSSQ